METTFDNVKFLFYARLRTDELVQSLGAERAIRDLVETMVVYMHHANQVNYLFQRQKKKNVGGHLDDIGTILEKVDNPETNGLLEKVTKGFEALFDQRAKPMILDFSDVQAIAYAVGTYQDGRSWFQRIVPTENPLDARIREHAQHYERFKQTGDLELEYFDEDIVSHIAVAANPEMQMGQRAKSLDEMFRKCCDYINRQVTLLQLADKRDSIHSHYADLSRIQTKEIAGYFQRRVEIDGILFRTLHLACLKLRGDSNPVEETERLHRDLMDSHKKDGFTDASYDP